MAWLLIILAAVGAGVSAAAVAAAMSPALRGLGERLRQRARPGPPVAPPAPSPHRPSGTAAWSAAGAAAGALAVSGLGWLALGGGVLAGAAAGPLVSLGWRWAQAKRRRIARLRSLVLLHEVVDLYAQAGYPLSETLAMAKEVIPEFRAELERCLRLWPQGPQRALVRLGEEIGVEGAPILTSVLQAVLEVGEGRLAGALSQEGGTLARLEELAAEEEIGLRPLYQSLYLALPGLAVSGLVAVPLLYRVVEQVMSVRAVPLP